MSPAAALAGKVYTTLMSQVTAGKKYGGLNEVESVAFPLRKSEISQLDSMGLVLYGKRIREGDGFLCQDAVQWR